MSLCRKKCTMYSWCHFILGTTYIEKTCVNKCLYSSMNQAYTYNKTATRFSQTKQYAQYTQRMILLGKHIHWLDVFRSQQVVFDFSIHVEFKATPTSPLVDWKKSLIFLWSDPSLKIIWKLPLTLKIIWQLLKMIVFLLCTTLRRAFLVFPWEPVLTWSARVASPSGGRQRSAEENRFCFFWDIHWTYLLKILIFCGKYPLAMVDFPLPCSEKLEFCN